MQKHGNMLRLIFFVPLMPAAWFGDITLFWMLWAAFGVCLTYWKFVKYQKANDAAYQVVKAESDKTFICLRCGEFYKPLD